MAIVTVSVHGEILDLDNSTPAVGSVTFKTLTELRDTVDNIVYEPATWVETLDVNGEFTVILPATDSPDITPTGWLYQVYISTATWRRTFYISLPAILAPAVEFADLIPVEPADGSGCTPDGTACAPISVVAEIAALQAEVDALQAELDALEVDVDAVEAAIVVINGQITTINTTLGALVGQVNTISPIVFANQAAITVLQGQVATIQAQILTLQTDLATLSANAVLKNPVSGAVYVGNQVIGPQATGTVPWLSNSSNPIPYSAGDTNFDFTRIVAIDEFGNQVITFTLNGNAEPRSRPSSRSRVGFRSFESAEAVGYSTGQFWQASSNPTVAANREAYLGVWGTASAKPGWAEATRVLSGLAGVSIGGTVNAALAPYNTLSAFNYRGLKATAGPPAAGTWALNDVILDSLGVVYRCTVAGTPGTWVGAVNGTPLAVSFAGSAGNAALISDGVSTGAPYALTTTYNAADNRVYFDGAVANNGAGAIAGGTTLFTVNAAHVPAAWVQFNERTSTTLSARVTVRTDGTVRIDQSLAVGATFSLDGLNYRKS